MPKRRVNVCLDDDLWQSIKRRAAASGISASQYIAHRLRGPADEGDRDVRVRAVRELGELNLPVAAWEEMEQEIVRARYACHEEESCTHAESASS